MTIRTISNLPAISADELTDGCLFVTAEPVYQEETEQYKYITKKVTFGNFSDKVAESLKDTLSSEYGLKPGMNVENIQLSTLSVYNADMTAKGEWTFKKLPYYKDNAIATQEYVQQCIAQDNSTYIGPTSVKHSLPDNMRIDNGNYESNVIMPGTKGSMTVYGWLADSGSVPPAKAWVALDGYVGSEWIHLQVQPWCIGEKHSQLQYIGFNVQVASNLSVRVSTGFEVNGQNSGMQNIDRSLTDSSPNCFKGYVIGGSNS